ncbi:HpcH/HpaI aldolase [Pyrenochaeta sp. DS3sAY3a]|nr:HpcH/HpaI aldolase [Pyrenochaeta sp. DS3sAY3a]
MHLQISNSLLRQSVAGKLTNAMGIRMVTDTQVVHLAANAGFNALFIDLEHSSLSIRDASQHCIVGMQLGVTPFVRVPYQCGNGFIQRVLDGGAMGVVFPHIHGREDAMAAVAICKYPPLGKRSMTGQLPVFSLRATPQAAIIEETNANASTVLLMIETKESIENVEEIASVPDVDVLMVGSNDLAVELGVPNQFKSEVFRSALDQVSRACKRHGKIMGLGGIYDDAGLHDWAINELGVGFILGGQDSAFIARAAKETVVSIKSVIKN